MRRSGMFLIATVAALGVGLLLSQSPAQPANPPAPAATRVAVCDVVTVFNKYERALDLSLEFDERAKQINLEAENRAKKIQDLGEILQALKPGSKEHTARLGEMEKLADERAVWMKLQEMKIVRERLRLTEQMYGEILQGIEELAKQRGLGLVLNREGADLQRQPQRTAQQDRDAEVPVRRAFVEPDPGRA
jgi:Skp family chaperone for outer membrane proteins